MTFQLEKTPWLPPAPADFSQRCKALAAAGNGGALVASLASFALSANQCATLARAEKGARHVEKLSDFRDMSGEEFARTAPRAPARDDATALS